jgi:hypothetical protein
MQIARTLVLSLLLLSLIAIPASAVTLSGNISGGQWFGGITYIYAISLDSLNFNFNIGLALLGNGPYFILNVAAGNYMLLAFQDLDGNLLPSLGDNMGYFGGQIPQTITVTTSNIDTLDIEVAPLPFTGISGRLQSPAGQTGLTLIQVATDAAFQNVTNTGFLLDMTGNGTYSVFLGPGTYYARAFMDLDFSFAPSAGDLQSYWGVPNNPILINVTTQPADCVNMTLMLPPDVTLSMTPAGAPIVIPATGGSFNYSIGLANSGATAVSHKVWLNATLPNGSTYPVVGPVTITLPAGFSGSRNRTQNVPAVAPAGSYSYNAFFGYGPALIWQQASFAFSKAGVDNASLGDWSCTGESLENWSDQTTAPQTVLPQAAALCSAFPNPFNPATVINYELPTASVVKLDVFDVSGRLVTTLANGWRDAGRHEVTFDGSMLASGMYVYRLQMGQNTLSGKMMLLK